MRVHVIARDSEMYGCENARFQERKRALFQIAPVCAFLRPVCGFFALDLRLVFQRNFHYSSESSTSMRSPRSSENMCRKVFKINFQKKRGCPQTCSEFHTFLEKQGVRKFGPKKPFSERLSWSCFPKVSEEQFSEKPEVRKFGFGEAKLVRKVSETQFSEKPGVRKFGPKSRFRRSQAGPKPCFERCPKSNFRRNWMSENLVSEKPSWSEMCPKSNFRRNRDSENLVRKAVFGEAKLVRKEAIFGETGGPKIWSEKPFSEKPSWSETMFRKVSEKQFSEKPEVRKFGFGEAKLVRKVSETQFSEKPGVRKFGPKSRFRRSQAGPKTCPKSNFPRRRGWSQSYPERVTKPGTGLKSYSETWPKSNFRRRRGRLQNQFSEKSR